MLGFNVPVDAATAEFLAEPGRFVEAIVAPEFAPAAFEILTTKPKWKANVRLLAVGTIEPGRGGRELRQISGGMLCQTADDLPDDENEWKVVTAAQPTRRTARRSAVRLGRVPAREVERDRAGEGPGARRRRRRPDEPRRFGRDRHPESGRARRGAVLASDAFFPFDDSIHRAAAAGIAAIIQPGGSRSDDEVIAACNQHGLAMIFTGRRHFRH